MQLMLVMLACRACPGNTNAAHAHDVGLLWLPPEKCNAADAHDAGVSWGSKKTQCS